MTRFLHILLLVLALALLAAGPAFARTATHYNTRGDFVGGSYSEFSSDGCSRSAIT